MDFENKKICVIGLGYIGLPTASLLATKGFKVLGVDTNRKVVETINKGKIHIVEPDLDILVKSAVLSGNLTASQELSEADIFIIAVPTPLDDQKNPDLSYVDTATRNLVQFLKKGDLVILESTSPVGTSEQVAKTIYDSRPDLASENGFDIYVAHCPERVLPGNVLHELVDNDRVIGGVNKKSTEKAAEFYKTFVRGEVIATDARVAELTKLAENAFRDVNIAFANELSVICARLGINVWEVIQVANRHPRVNILRPGPGVGGHCIAVDPWFIVSSSPDDARIIKTAREVNNSKPEWIVERVKERAARLKSPVVACLGLAFKPDIDDLRESPSIHIAKRLMEEIKGKVISCEPNVKELEGFELCQLESTLQQADIVVGLVAHKQFREIDPERLKEKILIDTCGLFR